MFAIALATTVSPLMPQDFTWVMALSICAGFFVAYGIGANDVANSFASSVGAKSLTLRQACIIASIFEFGGAFLMGSHVTDTVRKKITDGSLFENDPSLLMLGMFCALLSTGSWLLFATKMGLPVSTTHSTIGAIIGFSLVAKGTDAVFWGEFTKIVLSWIISPALSGGFGFVLFMIVKYSVLVREDPVKWGLRVWPFFLFVFLWINCFFIIYKGTPQLGLKDTPLDIALAATFAISVGLTIIITAVTYPFLKKKLYSMVEEDKAAEAKALELEQIENGTAPAVGAENIFQPAPEEPIAVPEPVPEVVEPMFEESSKGTDKKGEKGDDRPAVDRIKSFLDYDPDRVVAEDAAVKAVHDNAQVFSRPVEHLFTYLQVGTACFDAFAHGANDVANAIGPLAAVYALWDNNAYSKKANVELWQLALGGVGIVIGLATLGTYIIEAIGVKLVKITPSRGFAIELGSATTVIVAARLSIPVSTTHCQVGATTGVALAEGHKGINWLLFLKIVCSWLATCVIAAALSALLFCLFAFSPSAYCNVGST